MLSPSANHGPCPARTAPIVRIIDSLLYLSLPAVLLLTLPALHEWFDCAVVLEEEPLAT
jgi:hypothetical protein